MAMRKTLVAAKSQHRPEDCWFVMGAPSSSILMLKFCVFAMVAERWVRTALGSFDDKAERASRFFGSSMSSSSHFSVVLIDRVGERGRTSLPVRWDILSDGLSLM